MPLVVDSLWRPIKKKLTCSSPSTPVDPKNRKWKIGPQSVWLSITMALEMKPIISVTQKSHKSAWSSRPCPIVRVYENKIFVNVANLLLGVLFWGARVWRWVGWIPLIMVLRTGQFDNFCDDSLMHFLCCCFDCFDSAITNFAYQVFQFDSQYR